MGDQTLTSRLATYAEATTYERLPPEVVDRVKLIVFDELACGVLGREIIGGELIAKFVAQAGGAAEATVIGRGRAPVAQAALANGTAGHATEFDGAHVTSGHPGAVLVHACVAIGKSCRTTGKELINAISLGYDVGTRLVQSLGGSVQLRHRHHIHSDYLHGYGAAVAGARLLKLDKRGIRHAAALASGHAGGLALIFDARQHMSKALSLGQAASAGASAAMLATLGFEAHDNVFDSKHGPLGWSEDPKANVLLKGLGQDHAVMQANFKFYSAGYCIHAPVEAALNIVRANKIAIPDISKISVYLNSHSFDTVSKRDTPEISVEDMVATALVHGGLGYETVRSPDAVTSPAVQALRRMVEVVRDADLDRILPEGRPGKVVMATRSGEARAETVMHPRGHADRGGVGWPDLHEKWDGLMLKRLGDVRYSRFKEMCMNLETVQDINDVMLPLQNRIVPS